jgi:hypothetical protein
MNKNYIIVILANILLISGCAKDNRWDCFTGMGDMHTEVRELPAFDAIFTEDRIDFEYRYDSNYRIEVTFGENLLEHIHTEVVGNELRLGNDARCNWVRDLSKLPSVTLYAPHFSRFENRGNGEVVFKDTLRSSYFIYEEFEGNGDVSLLLHCDEVDIFQHTGRCRVLAKGQSDLVRMYSSGVGQLDGSALLSTSTLVNNSSFQDIRVNSSGYLFALITKQGDVCYTGSPTTLDINAEGSGQVIQCP